ISAQWFALQLQLADASPPGCVVPLAVLSRLITALGSSRLNFGHSFPPAEGAEFLAFPVPTGSLTLAPRARGWHTGDGHAGRVASKICEHYYARFFQKRKAPMPKKYHSAGLLPALRHRTCSLIRGCARRYQCSLSMAR